MRDTPAIAIIAIALVAVVRLWTTRHRRRSITIIIEDRTHDLNRDAQEPPPSEEDGGSGQ